MHGKSLSNPVAIQMRFPKYLNPKTQLAVCRYKNLDKLIHHVNLDGRVNLFYSTPANYIAAKKTYNASWPLKTDDLFPYADCPSCYWTGYYVTRPASKAYIRRCTAYLQAARQLQASRLKRLRFKLADGEMIKIFCGATILAVMWLQRQGICSRPAQPCLFGHWCYLGIVESYPSVHVNKLCTDVSCRLTRRYWLTWPPQRVTWTSWSLR